MENNSSKICFWNNWTKWFDRNKHTNLSCEIITGHILLICISTLHPYKQGKECVCLKAESKQWRANVLCLLPVQPNLHFLQSEVFSFLSHWSAPSIIPLKFLMQFFFLGRGSFWATQETRGWGEQHLCNSVTLQLMQEWAMCTHIVTHISNGRKNICDMPALPAPGVNPCSGSDNEELFQGLEIEKHTHSCAGKTKHLCLLRGRMWQSHEMRQEPAGWLASECSMRMGFQHGYSWMDKGGETTKRDGSYWGSFLFLDRRRRKWLKSFESLFSTD